MRLFLALPIFLNSLLVGAAGLASREHSRATENAQPAGFGQAHATTNSPTDEKKQAIALIKAGNFEGAAGRLKALQNAYPSDISIRIILVDAYFKAGMNSEGDAETQHALNSPALSQSEGLELAKALIDDRQQEAAQKVLAAVTAKWPDSAPAHAQLGVLLSAKGQYEEAVWQLGRAVQLQPGSSDYAQALAEVLLSWRHYSTALDFVTAEEQRFGELPDLEYCHAFALYGLRRHDEALAKLHALLDKHPRFDRAYSLLGTCYLDLGDAQKAAASFRKAIELNPGNPRSYISLAEVLRRNPQTTDEAISDARKGLRLDPASSEGKIQLALCYESKREYAQAQSLLQEVTQAHPELIPPHRILARIYHQQGDFSKAEREGKIAASLEARQQKPAPAVPPAPRIDSK